MVNILFEDNHIIVVIKPFNQLTQSDKTADKSLFEAVKSYIKEKYKKPGNVYLGLIHRLDRPVMGIVVFAKTSKAAARLSKQLREGKITKKYYALCECRDIINHGSTENNWSTLVNYIKKNPNKNIVSIIDQPHPGYKEAILKFRSLKHLPVRTGHDLSRHKHSQIFDINLLTGRSHQIRAQLSHLGYPIIGDLKYGADQPLPDKNIGLVNYSLSFLHPISNRQLTFQIK